MKPASTLLLLSLLGCDPEAVPHCDTTVDDWCASASTASCDWAAASNPTRLCGVPDGTSLGQCGAWVALKQPTALVTTTSYFDGTSGRLQAVINSPAGSGAATCLAGPGPNFSAPTCTWTAAPTSCPDGGP